MDRHRSRLAGPTTWVDERPVGVALARTVSVGVIGLFVAWPAARLIVSAVDATAARQVFGSERTWRIVGFTLAQATLSTLATLALALPGAWLLGRHRFRARRLLTALWSAPFALPSVVVGSALLVALPDSIERSMLSIIAAHVLFNVGMVTRVLGEAWEASDERLEQAAATLGASPSMRVRLMLRILLPELASLAGLVMALCLTSFGIIRILGGPLLQTIETEIHRQTFQNLRIDRAAVLALLQLVLVGSALVLTSRRRSGASTSFRSLVPMPRWIGRFIIVMLTTLTALPIVVLANRATRWPTPTNNKSRGLQAFNELRAITRGSGLLNAPIASLATSIRTALFATGLAVALALVTVVGANSSRVVTTIASLPLAVSGVTLGLGTLLGFAASPLDWRSRWWMVPVTQGMVAFPFALRVLRPAYDAIDPRLRQVAATLGTNRVTTFFRVVLPNVRGPLAAATALAAAVSLGEFGATSFLVRERSETIPVAIGLLTARPGERLQAQAAALCVILAAMTMGLTAAASMTGRRR